MRTQYTKRKLNDLEFGDTRLLLRFDKVIDNFSNCLGGTIPQSCCSKAEAKATYRFLKNPQVTFDKMIHHHQNSYHSQLLTSNRILHIMDTVEYDFTSKRAANDLGPMNYLKRRGLYQHNSILLSEKGAPLGLFNQSYIVRKDAGFSEAAKRKKLPFCEKESYRWYEHFVKAQQLCKTHSNLEVISIADREADIMELFQARTEERMHFIFRSKHNRKLSDGVNNLYPVLKNSKLKGKYNLRITDPKTKKKRKAKIEVRFCPVEIKLFKSLPVKRNLPSTQLYAVEAREVNAPKNVEKPVNWIFLTTLQIEHYEQALQVIKYYTLRWIIERFHYSIKSGGSKVEELQLTKAHRILNAMTAYSIAAMNVTKIRYWAEHHPDQSVFDVGISPIEYKVLYKYVEGKKYIKPNVKYNEDKPPNIREFTIILGQISGFAPSKRQPVPGIKIITRAVDKLNQLVDAYLTFCQ